MLYTCPKCHTVYDVPAEKARTVSKMKCAVCGNVWRITEEADDVENNREPFEPALPDVSSSFAEETVQREPLSSEGEELTYVEDEYPAQEAYSEEAPAYPDETYDFHASYDEPLPNPDFIKNPFDTVLNEAAKEKPPSYFSWVKPLYFLSVLFIFMTVYLFFFYMPSKVPLTFKNISYDFQEKDFRPYLTVHATLFNESEKDAKFDAFKVRFIDSSGRPIIDTDVPVTGFLPAKEIGVFDATIERPPANAVKVQLMLEKIELLEPSKIQGIVKEVKQNALSENTPQKPADDSKTPEKVKEDVPPPPPPPSSSEQEG